MLNARLEELKQRTLNRDHRKVRRSVELSFTTEELEDVSCSTWEAVVFRKKCEAEQPVILPDENLVFTRTGLPVKNLPAHAAGQGRRFGDFPGNICADWETSLGDGLLGRRAVAEAALRRYGHDPIAVDFLGAAIVTIDAVLDLARRYADATRANGREDIAAVLERVPTQPSRNLREALQSLRLLHSCLWLCSNHVGLGRFDQYLLPYYRADIATGHLTPSAAEELIAEFFISLNRDNDLYSAVQPGDNGQSLMLGGVTRTGKTAVNELTWMVLRVSRQVNMIDPKINLRINRDADPALLHEAVKLTRCGLGFPQYCNDDVIIPALAAHGYSLEDARDYSVAACWEFVIPGRAMDVPNINALSFPAAVDQAVRSKLGRGPFANLEKAVAANIRAQVTDYIANRRFDEYCYSIIMALRAIWFRADCLPVI